MPSAEICDGLDNDCDGTIDDGLTRGCGTDVGECVAGTQTCSAGSWGTCVGSVGPAAETCNNRDDDCDGAVDEELTFRTWYRDTDGDGFELAVSHDRVVRHDPTSGVRRERRGLQRLGISDPPRGRGDLQLT